MITHCRRLDLLNRALTAQPTRRRRRLMRRFSRSLRALNVGSQRKEDERNE